MTPAEKADLFDAVEMVVDENTRTPESFEGTIDLCEYMSRKGYEMTLAEADVFMDIWEEFPLHQMVRMVKRLRSELFLKLTPTFMTPEQASKYPEIMAADALLAKYPTIVEFWN